MRKVIVTVVGMASMLAGGLLPTELSAKPFTCPNPAICKAVCGKPTCGSALKAKSSSSSQTSASTSTYLR